MTHTYQREKSLSRLEEISQSLQKIGKASALIGFGSVSEVDRMDAYSDLDFLVIAKKGHKAELKEANTRKKLCSKYIMQELLDESDIIECYE